MNINDKFDLGAFEASNFSKQKEIASRIDEQLQSVGFLIVSNHGIECEKINNIWSALINFFNSNQDYKNKVKAPFKGYPYGYLISESETLAKSKGEFTPPDLKESFNGGPLNIPKGISSDALEFCYLPTIWPNLDNFRKSWEDYYCEMENLSKRLMTVFAIALKLPSNYFDPYIDKPISALRALNYPPINKNILPNQLRAGAHTDYGSLTILLPFDQVDGLQIKDLKGNWIDVPYVKDSFIINIGDLMALWTNDRWTSTLHRVIPRNKSFSRRTLVFFHQPNWDAKIKCLESCKGEGMKHLEVVSGPYLMEKFKSTT